MRKLHQWERGVQTSTFLLFVILIYFFHTFWYSCHYVEKTSRHPGYLGWWDKLLAPPYNISALNDSDLTTLVDLHDFKFHINSHRCDDRLDNLFLLVFVHSAPLNFRKRIAIRETWGEENNVIPELGMRLVFLIGEVNSTVHQAAILEEQSKYGDLIQGNFLDSYRNLTYKHIMGLKWITYFCQQAKYIFKTDDDIFVDIFQLIYFLKGNFGFPNAPPRLMYCAVYNTPYVKRSRRSKWYVSVKEYADHYYPSYCAGWGIIMSPDVVFNLYLQSSQYPFFWVDDVHVSGTLAQKAGIVHKQFNRDYLTNTTVKNWLKKPDNERPYLFGSDLMEEDIYAVWNKTLLYYKITARH